MKRVTLALVLVFGALVAIWLVTRGQRADTPIGNTIPEPTALPEVTSVLTEATGASARIAGEAAVSSASGQQVAPPPSSARRSLRGVIVVVDASGVEHRRESGTLTFVLARGDRGDTVEADVTEGACRVEVEGDFTLGVRDGLLGDRAVFPLPASSAGIEVVDGRFEARVLWPSPTILFARDARTGNHLGDLEVVAGSWPGADSSNVPTRTSDWDVVTLHGNSPFLIRAEDVAGAPYARRLHVRAPGHAWARTEFDRRRGGDVFVDLTDGAALDVEVTGHTGAQRTYLRVVRDERESVFQAELGERSSITVEGLPIGNFTVKAQLGTTHGNPLTLAEEKIVLVPGARARVRLALPEVAPIEYAPLSGVLVVPDGYAPARMGIMPRLLDKPIDERQASAVAKPKLSRKVAGFEEYEWSFARLPVGRHELTSLDPPKTIVVDLPPAGLAGVRIAVGPPVHVAVRSVDAETDEVIALEQITWRLLESEAKRGMRPLSVKRGPLDGSFAFVSPLGAIEIESRFAIEFEPIRMQVDLQPGNNDITLRLIRTAGLILRLKDGATEMKTGEIAAFEVSALEADAQCGMWQRSGTVTRVQVTRPGRYRVGLKERPAGFELPTPRVVDVGAGQWVEVAFDLARLH